ncbi:MAG: hypothetical protein WCI73_14035 [Phycisphaerae bacterium]
MARLGIKAKAYILSTGTRATWGTADSNGIHGGTAPASLSEMSNISDLTLNLTKGEADATTRAANGWKVILSALKEGSIEFEMNWEPTDTNFAFLFNAWLNDTTVAVAALDQASSVSGAQGLWADFVVTGFTKKEPLQEVQKVSVTIKPAASAVAPEWVKVTP